MARSSGPASLPNDADPGRVAFREDVRAAARVWRERPALPLTTFVLIGVLELIWYFVEVSEGSGDAGTSDGAAFGLIVLAMPLSYFLVGFMGTQRLWYRRAFDDEPFRPAEAWTHSWRFAWRFFVFGTVTGLPAVPGILLGFVSEWAGWAALVVAWILIDVWVTFATPALAYTTRSTIHALKIGWWFLRWHWHDIRWHALVPPLVIILGARTLPPLAEAFWPVSLLSLGGWMANLFFKGAQARRYLAIYDRAPASDG